MSEGKGWYAVTDQVPPKWSQTKVPMLGVRWIEMQDDEGYLAIRYFRARYVFEGVPRRKYEILKKHRAASVYFRQQIRDQYLCVDTKRYETPEAYQADEGPVREKLAAMAAKRLAEVKHVAPDQPDLFGNLAVTGEPKKSRRGLKKP